MAEGIDLVVAARRGDRSALAELNARHLPLVHHVVGRALMSVPLVGPAVRRTFARAARDLGQLTLAGDFRGWLLAIAVREAGALQTAGGYVERPDFVDYSRYSRDLTGHRAEAEEATRWIDAEYATVLPLWWLEIAGLITRDEIAAALRMPPADLETRIAGLRAQWEESRELVAALNAVPACPELAALTDGWDRQPAPVWRRGLAMHVGDCTYCQGAAAGLPELELLLADDPLVAVPFAVAAPLAEDGLIPESAVPEEPEAVVEPAVTAAPTALAAPAVRAEPGTVAEPETAAESEAGADPAPETVTEQAVVPPVLPVSSEVVPAEPEPVDEVKAASVHEQESAVPAAEPEPVPSPRAPVSAELAPLPPAVTESLFWPSRSRPEVDGAKHAETKPAEARHAAAPAGDEPAEDDTPTAVLPVFATSSKRSDAPRPGEPIDPPGDESPTEVFPRYSRAAAPAGAATGTLAGVILPGSAFAQQGARPGARRSAAGGDEGLTLLASAAAEPPTQSRPRAVLVLAAVAVAVILVTTGVLVLNNMIGDDGTTPVSAVPSRTAAPTTAAAPATSAAASPSASPSPSPSASASPSAKPSPSRTPSKSPSSAATGGPAANANLRSIEAVTKPDSYIRLVSGTVVVSELPSNASQSVRRNATFEVVAGLANPGCMSMRTPDGRFYLRHYEYKVRASENDGSDLFKRDATFCPSAGMGPGSVVLRSLNYPQHALRHRGDGSLYIDELSRRTTADSSFVIGSPLGR